MAKDIIPLVTSDIGNYNVNTDDDITIQYHNLSPVQTGQPNEYALGTRPLFGTATTTASIDDNSRGRGIADFKGYDLMLVNDDTWFRSGGSTEIYVATPFDKESMAKFTLYSQAGSERLVLVNAGAISDAGTEDGSIWFVADTTTAPTEIADADAPGYNGNSLCRGGVSLDGYFFVGDILGNIMNCNLDDITTWVSTSLVVAERESDTGIYIGKHKDHVFFLGTRSIEFFFNAANAAPASPLTRRADTFFNTGCYHPNTVLELGDITYFIGKDSTGETGLMKLENFQISRVGANPVIDKMISGLQYAEPVITGTTDLQQNVYLATVNSERSGQFLVLTMPNVGTFALHVATQIWARWYLGGTPDNNGGITDWEDPKIMPVTASLNRSGANAAHPNRYMLLNGLVSSETIESQAGGYQTTADGVFVHSYGTIDQDVIWFDALQADGSKMYTAHRGAVSGGTVLTEYTLSTPWDITTAVIRTTLDLDALVPDAEKGSRIATALHTSGACFSYDGTKLFNCEGFNAALPNYFQSFDLSTPWDIDTITYGGDFIEFADNVVEPLGIGVDPTGTKIIVGDNVDNSLKSYTMTANTVSTAVVNADIDVSTNVVNLGKTTVSDDGFKVTCKDGDGTDHLDLFTLTTAWDLSTATFTKVLFTAPGTGSPAFVNIDGHFERNIDGSLIVHNDDGDQFEQYNTLISIDDEFGGTLTGVDNADYIYYSKPWDLETNERKRINNIRLLHYPDPRTAVSTSNIGVDWINTDKVDGILPASFTGDVNININTMTARMYRGGITRQRIFKLTFTGGQTQIVKGLEIDYSQLRG